MPLRRARARRAGGPAVLLAVALLAGSCTADPEPAAPPAASEAAGDASLDLSRLPVPRADFCASLDEDGVAEALNGPPTGTDHYGNGDELEIRPGEVDVSHEFGCVFEAADGTVARAWVFARPVDRSEARTLVRRARRGRDCAFPRSLTFGRPGLTSVCEVPGGTAVRARLQGLFGDSWVGCEVTEHATKAASPGTRLDVVQRADQWCTEVVTAISAAG